MHDVTDQPGVAAVGVDVADEIQSGVSAELVVRLADRASANRFTVPTARPLWGGPNT
jgi:hypothetical protein